VFSVAEWQAHAPRILRGGHAARVSLRVYRHCYTAALPTTGRSGPPPCPRIRPPSARIFPLPAFTESQTNFPPKYGHSTFGFAPAGGVWRHNNVYSIENTGKRLHLPSRGKPWPKKVPTESLERKFVSGSMVGNYASAKSGVSLFVECFTSSVVLLKKLLQSQQATSKVSNSTNSRHRAQTRV